MNCLNGEKVTDREYFTHFFDSLISRKVPVSGSFDLTHRCNLKCIHCYLGHLRDDTEAHKKELGTAKICSLLDQIADAGCLYLLLSGGEPLLRKDFGVIYRHAKEKGLIVTVFSNGTLLSQDLLDLFSEFPPMAVEISLYGATEPTYEAITGVKGSYRQCRDAIEALKRRGITFLLKTILMKQNLHEYFSIEKIAEEYGVPFRMDPCISPCLNGDRRPLDTRVSPQEAVSIELSSQERLGKWKKHHDKCRALPSSDKLYDCGAGITNFHIDAEGLIKPCLMTSRYAYDPGTAGFSAAWDFITRSMESLKVPAGFSCIGCTKNNFCGLCPATFEIETGSELLPSEYLCAIGKERFEKITNGI